MAAKASHAVAGRAWHGQPWASTASRGYPWLRMAHHGPHCLIRAAGSTGRNFKRSAIWSANCFRPKMAVLSSETRPDDSGLSQDSVFRPNPSNRTLPGPVRATFGHFRRRPSRPSGCKSVGLTTGLWPHGPDGFPGTVVGPLAGPLAGWLPWLAGWVAPA